MDLAGCRLDSVVFHSARTGQRQLPPKLVHKYGVQLPPQPRNTVAELYLGFLVGASANRSQRNLEATLARIDQQEKQIRAVEGSLSAALMENTQLTKAVKMNTDLLQESRDQVRSRREPAGQKR